MGVEVTFIEGTVSPTSLEDDSLLSNEHFLLSLRNSSRIAGETPYACPSHVQPKDPMGWNSFRTHLPPDTDGAVEKQLVRVSRVPNSQNSHTAQF